MVRGILKIVTLAQRAQLMQTISIKSLHTKLQDKSNANIILVDVRTKEEYDGGHIAQAVNFPLNTLQTQKDEISKYATAYIICHSGGRSRQGCCILAEVGLTNSVQVVGGIMQWTADGFEVVL